MPTYNNPVIPGCHPDPSICRVGDDYYLATSSFEYYPGVPLFHSRDLVHWQQIGHALTRPSQLDLRDVPTWYGIYAPTLRYHQGRFYLITTNCKPDDRPQRGHFFVYADDIYGVWSDPIWINGDGQGTGHDPDLFWDDDGTVYYSRFTWEQGITQWPIDLATGHLLSEGRSIWQGFEDRYCEAPHIYKINGWYYLVVAEGGTARGHMVVVARSHAPTGPFIGDPHNPILTHRALVTEPIVGTGHGDLVQAHDGSWWLVFLAMRPLSRGYHILGRETFLAPITWTDDGWPVVNQRRPIQAQMEVDHLLPAAPVPMIATRDDFATADLALQWNFRRNPVPGSWSLTDRPGSLALSCLPASLDMEEPQSFIGRRQQHFTGSFRAQFDFAPLHNGAEAGLCAIQNEQHHYEIAIRQHQDRRMLIVRRHIGDLVAVVYEHDLIDGLVDLAILFQTDQYRFAFAQGFDPLTVVAEGAAKYLSSEVGGAFTGVYLGMYATGSAADTAFIDWCEYQAADA